MAAHPLYLAGEWRMTDRRIAVTSPFDGSSAGEICLAGPAEFEEALQRASDAFSRTRDLAAHERAAALAAISRTIHEEREDFARTITLEMGKTIRESRAEVDRAIQTFRISSEEAGRHGGEILDLGTAPGHEGRFGLIRRFPRGVVVGITPFNFPLNLVAHKVGPALAAGAPIIVKPASKTPLTALRLARVIAATALPPGAVSVLPSPGSAAESLALDARVAVVTFTGSAETGWALRAKAPRKHVSLELGGNAAVVVEPDADLEFAARRIVAGAFAIAGQSCISVQRIFAHRDIYPALLRKLASHAGALRSGNPLAEETDLGPVVDAANAERIVAWIEAAARRGASIVGGGTREGNMVLPTLLTNVPETERVACDEVFGPVAVVAPYDTFEGALRRVNDSRFGLQAGIFTRDLGKALEAHRTLEVGGIIVGDIPSYRADAMPYGGTKESGNTREGPRWAIEEMTEPRVMVVGGP